MVWGDVGPWEFDVDIQFWHLSATQTFMHGIHVSIFPCKG